MGLEDFLSSQTGEDIVLTDSKEESVDKPEVAETEASATEEPTSEEAVDSSEENKAEKTEETEETEKVDSPTASSFEEMWAERMGEKYGKLEDFDDHYSSLKAKSEQERYEDKYSEESRDRLDKLLESGTSWEKIKEIANVQTLDVEKLTGRQAMAKALELDQGLTRAEIENELYDYDQLKNVDLDDLDDRELIKHNSDLSKFARLERESKSYLSELKQDKRFSLPELAKKEEVSEETLKAQEKMREDAIRAYETDVSNQVSSLNNLDIKIGEKDVFKYELTKEDKQIVESQMKGVNNYYTNFMNDGKLDMKSMSETLAKGLVFDKAIKAALESQSNAGEEAAVKKINNTNFDAKSTAPDTSGMSAMQQIAAKYRDD